MPLKALALNGTLKTSGSSEASSTGKLLESIAEEFKKDGVETETVRLADHNIKAGVTSDEGEGDEWPAIRAKVLEADILLMGTPIWLVNPEAFASGRSNGWTLSWKRLTNKAEWFPMVRSPP
jgi:nucleotide-binding universal stress UspA family protein